MKQFPSDDVIEATHMLTGEIAVICSCCLGERTKPSIFGRRRCGQCNGLGYDLIGRKARRILFGDSDG